jgi:hypothetical protein
MDWVKLILDGNKRQAVVTTVMNPQVPLNGGNFFAQLTNYKLPQNYSALWG